MSIKCLHSFIHIIVWLLAIKHNQARYTKYRLDSLNQRVNHMMVHHLLSHLCKQLITHGNMQCAQGHMYMEPQVAVADPDEDGAVVVSCASQSYDMAMDAVGRVLGLPHSKVRELLRSSFFNCLSGF